VALVMAISPSMYIARYYKSIGYARKLALDQYKRKIIRN
jgi:hypothetical protein